MKGDPVNPFDFLRSGLPEDPGDDNEREAAIRALLVEHQESERKLTYLHDLASLCDKLPNGTQVTITVQPHVAFPADATIPRDRMRGALLSTNEWLAGDEEDEASLDAVTDTVMATIAAAAHARRLADDPELTAALADIERQLADSTFDPGPGLDLAALKERYSCRCDDLGTLMCRVHNLEGVSE